MSPRTLRLLFPILALLVALFGLYHLFAGGLAIQQHNWPFAVFYLVFGFGGLALAQALWRATRRLGR